jgi:hypothetical protein
MKPTPLGAVNGASPHNSSSRYLDTPLIDGDDNHAKRCSMCRRTPISTHLIINKLMKCYGYPLKTRSLQRFQFEICRSWHITVVQFVI